ncbi:MAG TPA: M28 family peptidase [Solirubrobacterales bacterium]|nr:M28 family peptidase [Solirubrobacterales bacterium]
MGLGRKTALLLLAIVLGVGLGACGGSATSTPAEAPAGAPDRFDSELAWRLTKRQVEVGQRPAGSPQLQRLASELRPMLPQGRFEAIPGEPALRNIVGTLPGRQPAIVVGAHYDTLAAPKGFVGANNGAAGTAAVIAIARALSEAPGRAGQREVDFVLFDGEEPAEGTPEESKDFLNEGLRGSRAYVEAHPGETMAMVLLDYVANRDLELRREANSTPQLWRRLLAAADVVGKSQYFSAATGPAIADDHAPFLLDGVPAIDLIDWKYPGHSLKDGLDRLSPQSLDAVGEAVTQLVLELRE